MRALVRAANALSEVADRLNATPIPICTWASYRIRDVVEAIRDNESNYYTGSTIRDLEAEVIRLTRERNHFRALAEGRPQ